MAQTFNRQRSSSRSSCVPEQGFEDLGIRRKLARVYWKLAPSLRYVSGFCRDLRCFAHLDDILRFGNFGLWVSALNWKKPNQGANGKVIRRRGKAASIYISGHCHSLPPPPLSPRASPPPLRQDTVPSFSETVPQGKIVKMVQATEKKPDRRHSKRLNMWRSQRRTSSETNHRQTRKKIATRTRNLRS